MVNTQFVTMSHDGAQLFLNISQIVRVTFQDGEVNIRMADGEDIDLAGVGAVQFLREIAAASIECDGSPASALHAMLSKSLGIR